MKPRKNVSKRRWKARAEMGRWLPYDIVFAIDTDPAPISERWFPHPTEPRFMRLKSSWKHPKTPAELAAGGHEKLAEVAEVGL